MTTLRPHNFDMSSTMMYLFVLISFTRSKTGDYTTAVLIVEYFRSQTFRNNSCKEIAVLISSLLFISPRLSLGGVKPLLTKFGKVFWVQSVTLALVDFCVNAVVRVLSFIFSDKALDQVTHWVFGIRHNKYNIYVLVCLIITNYIYLQMSNVIE